MYPSSFHMLHDPRDKHRFAIADRIDFDLFAKHIAVDEHRMLRIDVNRFFHIFQQFLVGIYYFHSAPAEHVGWANKNRVS
ncbi:hypothetical protein D3C77_360120 [compost metagenome]